MKIRQKLVLVFIGISLFIGIVGYAGVMHNDRIIKILTKAKNIQIPSLIALLDLKEASRQASIKAVEYSLTGKDADRHKVEQALEKMDANLHTLIKANTNHGISLEKQQAISKDVDLLKNTINKYITKKGVSQADLFQYENKIHGARKKLIFNLYEQISIKKIHLDEALTTSQETIAKQIRITIFLTLIALLVTIILAVLIAHLFTTPIIKLKNLITQIGKGNLDAKLEITSRDEIGSLAESFNEMAESLQREKREREQVSRQLQNIEWLLKKSITPLQEESKYLPPYGDLICLNTKKILLNSVGQEVLKDIVDDVLDLLETSSAVYETNGDYAHGIFSSGWCKFLDNASRKLCKTDDNKEALDSGLWLCHESCWTTASKTAIETGQPQDIECNGGIRLYAIPIFSGQEIVGSINFGYGTPPADKEKLEEIAKKYNLPFEKLLEKANEYEERPKYITEIAKKRLHSAARLIGEIVERKQVEEKLWQSQNILEQRVEERTKELKKSKEDWEKTFDAIEDIITIQDNEMRIIHANQATRKFFEVEFKDIIGKFCYELFRGSSKPCSNCPELKTFSDKKSHSQYITHKNLEKTFNVTSTPLHKNDEAPQQIVHIARDITEHKNMEEELFQAHKMEAIGTLAGGIAHDFNNILAAIIGYTELAKDSIREESPVNSDLDQVLKASKRAKELVSQILTFSRKNQDSLEAMKPNPVIKEAINLIRASLPVTISIKDKIEPIRESILANPTNIHQILVNLCTNALHAIEDEQGKITVSLKQVDLAEEEIRSEPGLFGGSFIELMVSDDGSGMDQRTVDRIFDPYFTTKEVGKGNGMGLSVVQGIVQNCGGFIKVDSTLGQGSKFMVYFPSIITDSSQEPEDKQRTSLPPGNEHIMVVDDEKAIIDMYKLILERQGYKVTAHFDSKKSLEDFQSDPGKFDLLITDQAMPGLTGYELAEKILQLRPDMPIILCTGFSSVVSEKEAKEIGIKQYLLKPLSRNNLLLHVRELLNSCK
jgi:PAS domain S-box-containing protein